MGFLETAIGSDHCPVIISLQGTRKKGRRDFKFEMKWLLEEECQMKVNESWGFMRNVSHTSVWSRKIKKTSFKLKKWSKKKYGRH
ncbi:hypothetical protein V6N12_016344 [Hibiscus sabdariffa]|uniref:Uncharacterized protein n=1 Tax=Hibiscus sabdariffa TaxID=183260 RepID=A0ABR2CDT4_9ROSI